MYTAKAGNIADCWPSAVGADEATVAKVTEMIMQQLQQKRISWRTGDERSCWRSLTIVRQTLSVAIKYTPLSSLLHLCD